MNRILLIDDDVDFRETISDLLVDRGYRVDSARNGKEATTLLQSLKYNLILCDLNMPQLNGVTLLKNLRTVKNNVPFIIITGDMNIENVAKAFEFDPTDYISKPFSAEELFLKVEENLDTEIKKPFLIQ